MSEFYVFWRAQLKEGDAESEVCFMRVIDELGAYPRIIAPIYDGDIDCGSVGFGFALDGFNSPLGVRDWAEWALRNSLHHAQVGTPDRPDRAVVSVSLWLEDNPTIRLMAVDWWLAPLNPPAPTTSGLLRHLN